MLVGGRLRAHIVPLAVSVHFIPYVSRCTYSLGDNPVIDAVPLSLEKFRAVQVVSLCFLAHASGYRPIGDGSFDGGAAGDDGPGTTARPRSTTVVVRCLSHVPAVLRRPQMPRGMSYVILV